MTCLKRRNARELTEGAQRGVAAFCVRVCGNYVKRRVIAVNNQFVSARFFFVSSHVAKRPFFLYGIFGLLFRCFRGGGLAT